MSNQPTEYQITPNFVARCTRQLIGPADWFLSQWDPYAMISLEAVAYSSYRNTVEWFWWD